MAVVDNGLSFLFFFPLVSKTQQWHPRVLIK